MVAALKPDLVAVRTTSLPEEIRRDFRVLCIERDTSMEEETIRLIDAAVRRNAKLEDVGRVGSTQLNIRRIPRELKDAFKMLCQRRGVPMERALVKIIADEVGYEIN